MKKVWTKKMARQLTEQYPAGNLEEVAESLGVSRNAVRSYANKLGLKRAVNVKHVWTPEEEALLRELYAETDTRDICRLLGIGYGSVSQHAVLIGLRKSHEYKSRVCNPGGRNGASTRFRKGHIPANKGMKEWQFRSSESIEKVRQTQFRKGNVPHNARPVGSEVVHADGYVYVKVPGGTVPKHIHVWRQHNGEIPNGMIVTFIDGDRSNCDVANLRLMSREEAVSAMQRRMPPERRKEIIEKIQKKRNETIRKDYLRIRWGLEPKTRLVKRWHAPERQNINK